MPDVRMYLSSFRMENHPEVLLELAGKAAHVAVIVNAMDAAPDDVRQSAVLREVETLEQLGFDAEELDLRDYFRDSDRLTADLRQYEIAWLRGGNSFMLRYALAKSGADIALRTELESDAIVYAGYSAGACVLAPSLVGLELVDQPHDVEAHYGEPPIWDGLGVLPYAFVPHYRSPGHPETEAVNEVVRLYEARGIPFKAFRDGQVLVVRGNEAEVLA